MTRKTLRSSDETSTKRQVHRPTSSHSLPTYHQQQAQARDWALPHSSGDTALFNMTAQSDPVHATRGSSARHTQMTDLPMRSTPTPSSARTMSSEPKDSLEILGGSVKILLHAIRDLERHGIDAAASMPLPKIVVVGDQSAGKSSLIEAISEINLPRDSGTCTRCVIHVNLRDEPRPEWSCQVSLVRKYYNAPHIRESELYPWADMEQEVIPFVTVHNKCDLEDVIRRAQIATLNPGKDPRSFRRTQLNAGIEVPFSPNIISLEIAAPGLPNLSFYDLPGVISQSQDGGQDTVRLIKSLASSYMEQENTIILLTVPMESDIDNSMSSALIDQIPGAADRTIGVLTKPDRLQSDDRVDTWNAVLRGQTFQKGHGYFVVKQPSQADLNAGITTLQARASEQNFFRSATWTDRFGGSDVGINDRLGTRNLQVELSKKLAHLILDVMPSLKQQVQSKLTEVKDELSEYPEPPANAMQVVTQAINDFTQDFQNKVLATEPNDLSESWKQIKDDFHVAVVSQRPTLQLKDVKPAKEDWMPLPRTQKPKSIFMTPTKRRSSAIIDLSSDEEATPTRKMFKAKVEGAGDAPGFTGPLRSDLRKVFGFADLKSTLEAFNTSGLPSVVELKAVDHLILLTLRNWHIPLEVLIKKLQSALVASMGLSLQNKVGQWRTTKLYEEMQTANLHFLDRHLSETKSYVHRALRIERVKPITRDEQLNKYIIAEQATFTDHRMRVRYEQHVEEQMEQAGKPYIRPAWDEKAKKHAAVVLDADVFDREISVMAKICAYYQIASMRFIDQVVQAVEAELLIKFREELYHELSTSLDVYGENGFANANRLVADDPEREERRAQLKEKKSRLEQARKRIVDMHRQFDAQNPMAINQ